VKSTKANILVTDACRGAAVAVIRSLARSGYNVIAADSDACSPGLASRYVKHRVVYTCPKSDPHQFIEDLLEAVEKYQIDLIIPVTEQAVLPLEAERERVERVCRVPWAPLDSVDTVRDKGLTFELAEKLNVPYPQTCLVHTAEEAVLAAPNLGWPLVLKPNSSHTMSGQDAVRVWSVSYARDEQDLREKMKPFEGTCPVLLQEYFQGAGVGVEVLAHEGEPICAFQHRRLREVPLTGGASSIRRSDALDPQLYAYSLDLLKALKWTGLAMVEFKQNEQGEARLMEINGRIWGSLPVAVAAGVDFPVALCELTLHGPPDSQQIVPAEYHVGMHVQNFQKELSWIIRVLRGTSAHPVMDLPRRRDAVGAIIDLLRPSYRFDILSLSDPMPGVRLMANFCRAAWQSFVARLTPKKRRGNVNFPNDTQSHELIDIKQPMTSRAK
jgi:predicted ATP-grasp superfamily ATP-dependent carboligase